MNARLQIVSPFSQTTTVAPWGFAMLCAFTFDPGEPPVWHIEHSHPGSPPNAELLSCKVSGVDITEMLSSCQRERIEEKLIEQMEAM